MFHDLLVLLANLVCIAVALISFGLCFAAIQRYWEALHLPDNEECVVREYAITPRQLLRFAIITGAVFIAAAVGAYELYLYLVDNAFYMLELFGIWYLIGFISRSFIMVLRQEIFSRIFAIEWESVMTLPFFAVGGPFVTMHLTRVLFWEKRWWEY